MATKAPMKLSSWYQELSRSYPIQTKRQNMTVSAETLIVVSRALLPQAPPLLATLRALPAQEAAQVPTASGKKRYHRRKCSGSSSVEEWAEEDSAAPLAVDYSIQVPASFSISAVAPVYVFISSAAGDLEDDQVQPSLRALNLLLVPQVLCPPFFLFFSCSFSPYYLLFSAPPQAHRVHLWYSRAPDRPKPR